MEDGYISANIGESCKVWCKNNEAISSELECSHDNISPDAPFDGVIPFCHSNCFIFAQYFIGKKKI